MISLDPSYAYARRLTRAKAKSFYYAFLFLPPHRRRSIYTIYAFSRRADDAVDAVEENGTSEEKARSDLDFLRSLLGEAPVDDPLFPALRDTVQRFSIDRELFEELLRGMETDLWKKTYRTYDELREYCYRAASVVGLISIEIFGHDGAEVRQPAIELGIAMQLTNVLRDVVEDLQRGRIYLPEEDLARFGYTAEDLRRRVADDRFRSLMEFEVKRARDCFRSAERLFPRILEESKYCPVLLQRFYLRILDRIERQGYDVFRRRPRLRWSDKLEIAARTWLDSRKSNSTDSR